MLFNTLDSFHKFGINAQLMDEHFTCPLMSLNTKAREVGPPYISGC